MSPEERKKWEGMAENDKKRYEVEKAIYVGPWTRTIDKKRYKKDEMAPKRPMSAFLDYSKTLRSFAIQTNPQVRDNKEISKILGTMWANASEKEKKPFVEKELKLRAEYIKNIALWRLERNELIKKERQEREAAVQGAIENGTSEELIKAARVAQKAAQKLPKTFPKVECTIPTTLNAPDIGHLSHDCCSLNSPEPPKKQMVDHVPPHHMPPHTCHQMPNSQQVMYGKPDTSSWNAYPVSVDVPFAGVDPNSLPLYNHQQHNGNCNVMGGLQAADHTKNNYIPGYHSGNFSNFQPYSAHSVWQSNFQTDHYNTFPRYNPGVVPANANTHNQSDFSTLQPYPAQGVSSSMIDHFSSNANYPTPTPNIFNSVYNSGNVPVMHHDYFSGTPNNLYTQQMYGKQTTSESMFGTPPPQINPCFTEFSATPDATIFSNAWNSQHINW